MSSHFTPALSSPSWGLGRRVPLGGLALVAFWALSWSLFLGTVGARGGPRAGATGPELTSPAAVSVRCPPAMADAE
jgi:hypothetical protein